MAQRKPDEEKPTIEQILQLVQKLSVEDRAELQHRLDQSTWGAEWDRLSAKIQAQFSRAGDSVPTEEEVVEEVRAVRQARKERRAQGSN